MIPNETRVQVNMANSDNMSVIALLNELGGEVVRELNEKGMRIGYLVAYDAEHIPAIEQARETDEKNGAPTMFFKTLGKMRPKEFPGDERYYLLAFPSEVNQN